MNRRGMDVKQPIKTEPGEKKMKKNCDFPLFISLEGKEVWIYGAGTIALRRAGVLVSFGAKVRVIAPEAKEELLAMSRAGTVRYEKRPFKPGEICGSRPFPFMVLAATDSPAVNSRVAAECARAGILMNNAGDRSQNDFYFPAVVREEGLVIGLTGTGEDHKKVRRAAAWVRNHIREISE